MAKVPVGLFSRTPTAEQLLAAIVAKTGRKATINGKQAVIKLASGPTESVVISLQETGYQSRFDTLKVFAIGLGGKKEAVHYASLRPAYLSAGRGSSDSWWLSDTYWGSNTPGTPEFAKASKLIEDKVNNAVDDIGSWVNAFCERAEKAGSGSTDEMNLKTALILNRKFGVGIPEADLTRLFSLLG
jgi:hypothetical protein